MLTRNSGPATPRPADPQSDADRRVGARMLALGFAMRLKLGEADDRALGSAVIATAEALGFDDPITVEVKAISRGWRHLRLDKTGLENCGDALLRAVQRSSWPAPGTRADLDG